MRISIFSIVVIGFVLGCSHEQTTSQHKPVSVNPDPVDFFEHTNEGRSREERVESQVGEKRSFDLPKDVTKNVIKGRCNLKTAKDLNIQTPCNNITVVLKDSLGKVLLEKPITRGEFEFKVKDNKSYKIGIKSKKYRLSKGKEIPAKEGDDLLLTLVPR